MRSHLPEITFRRNVWRALVVILKWRDTEMTECIMHFKQFWKQQIHHGVYSGSCCETTCAKRHSMCLARTYASFHVTENTTGRNETFVHSKRAIWRSDDVMNSRDNAVWLCGTHWYQSRFHHHKGRPTVLLTLRETASMRAMSMQIVADTKTIANSGIFCLNNQSSQYLKKRFLTCSWTKIWLAESDFEESHVIRLKID